MCQGTFVSNIVSTIAALAVLTPLVGGCRDNFRCGVRVDGTIQQCNGPNEVCICDTHRCASPVMSTCASGLRYTRKQTGDDSNQCVPPANRWRQAVGANLCPGEENQEITCGLVGGPLCPTGSQCVCSVQRCVRKVSTDQCASQLVWQSTQQCVDNEVSLADLDAYRPNSDGTCPEVLPPIPECGVLAATGTPQPCAGQNQCSCKELRCMQPVPLSRCTTGYAYASNGRCVGVQPQDMCPVAWSDGTCIDTPYAASIEVTFLGSRNSCADPRPPEVSCGTPSPTGGMGASCASGQSCICAGPTATPFRCAKPVEAGRCMNGLAWSYDGLCVDGDISLDKQRYFSTRPDGVCPELAGRPQPECGYSDNGQVVWCSNSSDSCFCPNQRCVFPVPFRECDSGWAYRSDGRCVEKWVSTSTCASGRAYPDGGCILPPVATAISADVLSTKGMCPGAADGGI